MCADVVIVGGGPIGCWTALQIKKRNPELDIRIYERNEEYQRDHMLSLKRASLQRYSKRTGDDDEKSLYQKISAAHNSDKPSDSKEALRNVTYIRTLDFENILKDHCAKLGIGIAYEKIETPEDVMARHPECSIFIAADGAHSAMRTALLGEDSVVKKDLLPSVDVKYDVEGQAKYLHEPTYDKMDMIVIESIGKAADAPPADPLCKKAAQEAADKLITQKVQEFRDALDSKLTLEEARKLARQERERLQKSFAAGELPVDVRAPQTSQVALRFLVDEETYDKFPDATFKKPLSLQDLRTNVDRDGTTLTFGQSLGDFWALRGEHTGEKRIEGSEKITKVKLSQYASKKFAVRTESQGHKTAWFLAGDAAMGMPFYRSINSGLMLGSQLGAIIGNSAISLNLKTRAYDALRPFKLAREFGAVSAKLSGIRVYKKAVRPVLRGLARVGLGVVAVPAIALIGLYMLVNPKARLM